MLTLPGSSSLDTTKHERMFVIVRSTHVQHNIVVESKLMKVLASQWNVVCTCLHEQGLQTVGFCV